MSENKCIGRHLVRDNRIFAYYIVAFHKSHGLSGSVLEQGSALHKSFHAEAIGLAQVFQSVAQGKIKGADRIVRLGIGSIDC